MRLCDLVFSPAERLPARCRSGGCMGHTVYWYTLYEIMISLDGNVFERCSRFACVLFFCKVAVEAGECDDRDQSAAAQTAPQQTGFGSYRASTCWLSGLFVIVQGGDMKCLSCGSGNLTKSRELGIGFA